ncbi:MAG: hypothetical protein ACYS22_07145 [Planctomycetota bacterium]
MDPLSGRDFDPDRQQLESRRASQVDLEETVRLDEFRGSKALFEGGGPVFVAR